MLYLHRTFARNLCEVFLFADLREWQTLSIDLRSKAVMAERDPYDRKTAATKWQSLIATKKRKMTMHRPTL